MKKWDVAVVLVALAVAGGLYFSGLLRANTPGGIAVVYVDGVEETRLSLLQDSEYRVETDHGYNLVVVKDGKAEIIDADCPDKICVNHKPISFRNESITCLPHKVVVEIEGGNNNAVDAVAQ
ncbi:MAG: NusG domain II-containing protein [Lachnospiraceae bacterium]|nr:NusG domain II-containing protein [Lachnospiraceae bacterium]